MLELRTDLDLAGELWGWMMDTFENYVSPCTDCAYIPTSSDRAASNANGLIRGGVFQGPKSYLSPTYRGGSIPALPVYGIGIRCARAPTTPP
jgi:formylglycine-generating enzyme required for sulfatase activity